VGIIYWVRFFVALRKAKEGFLSWEENYKWDEILRCALDDVEVIFFVALRKAKEGFLS